MGNESHSGLASLFQVSDMTWRGGGPVSFDLSRGEIIMISGESGAGKSLLLRALADLDPQTGDLRLGGVSVADHRPPVWRRKVLYAASDSHWWMSRVGDHFPAPVDLLLSELGFDPEVNNWSVDRLSAGERQRLAIARALAHGPKVLLLDEPTANLDERNAQRVENMVVERCANSSIGVIWVSHDPDQIRRVGSRHYRLHGGILEADSALSASVAPRS